MSVRVAQRQMFDRWLALVSEEQALMAAATVCAGDSSEGQEVRLRLSAVMSARIDAKNRFNELSAMALEQERIKELLELDARIDEERAIRTRPTVPNRKPKPRQLKATHPSAPKREVTVGPRLERAHRVRWRDFGSSVEETVPVIQIRSISDVPSSPSHALAKEIDLIAEREFRDAPWRVRSRQRGRRYEGFQRGLA